MKNYNVLLDNEDDCNVDISFGCSNEEASNLPVCDENIIDNCCNYIELNNVSGFSANPLILKIIKTEGQQQPPSPDNPNGNPTWGLMMKNVYGLGAYQVNKEDFILDIFYENPDLGTPVNFLTEGDISNQLLLQVFNFDDYW